MKFIDKYIKHLEKRWENEGTPVKPISDKEIEKRRRINVALWAYAYEIMSDPIVPDNIYDAVAKQINLSKITDSVRLDVWFENNYSAEHCKWIYAHPEFEKIGQRYRTLRATQTPRQMRG